MHVNIFIMIHKTVCFTTIFLLPLLLLYSLTFAHGTGVSFEENKDGYKIDIGHDEFIAAKESTRFDFALFPEDITNIEGEVFSDVWVTFTQNNKIFFAGGVAKPEFGVTGFTYVFPEAGVYTVSARFQKNGETIVKTEFPLTVIEPLEEDTDTIPPYVVSLVVGVSSLIVGLCIGFIIGRKKRFE